MRPLLSSAVEAHVDTCGGGKNEVIRVRSAVESEASSGELDSFALMIGSSKLIARGAQGWTLGLFLIDGKLLPTLTSGAPSKGFDSVWDADVNLRCFGTAITPQSKLHVCTNIAPDGDEHTDAVPRIYAQNVPVLKSMLQKAVRRGRSSSAVALCGLLRRIAPDELLRRLPVIAIEDALLHPGLPVLVWLMVASSKGYRVPSTLWVVVARVVEELALCSHRDFCPPTSAPCTFDDLFDSEVNASSCLVSSLLVRASYGGMPGDVSMLRNYAGLWRLRLGSAGQPSSESTSTAPPHPFLHVDYLTSLSTSGEWGARLVSTFSGSPTGAIDASVSIGRDDLLSEGFDFHCDPHMTQAVLRRCPAAGLAEGDLREAVWLFRSGVNLRPPWPFPEVQLAGRTQLEAEVRAKRRLSRVWQQTSSVVIRWSEAKVAELAADLGPLLHAAVLD
jgi:hypothetical protein